ncbi:MAG: glutamate formimidoyltransferase [Calditrichaeota bacterium]|nr:MAG: glutamate formimidoyltransferase [Calditrichota bacterium]
MAKKLVECVPNFSEGRNKEVIDQITAAIRSVPEVELLSVEMGADVNRTVITFIGPPEPVAEAAFRAIAKATELIDMRQHKGAHPRMGATDVCPFVPVSGVTMEEVVELSRRVARRVGEELGIPVYLYEYSATRPERRSLANIRAGEYEGLPEKLKDPAWKPDFGPAEFNPKTGATVIGAREFLIAYNITLNTRDKQLAMDIAFELREKGRSVRTGNIHPVYMRGELVKYQENHFPCGSCSFVGKTIEETAVHCQQAHGYDLVALLKQHGIDPSNPVGRSVKKPGKFKHCRAIGWYVKEYGRAQISCNLTNYKVTPPHLVLEEARRLAAERGLVVTGSEIVGLVPFDAIYQAGLFYLSRQGYTTGLPVKDVLEAAIHSMGLNDVAPFVPEEKILGLPRMPRNALMAMRADELVHEVSRETPAPGGGSIAALAGALGSALAAMVSNLTVGKKGYQQVWPELDQLARQAQKVKDQLIEAVDADTQAFNDYLEALRLPQNNEEEIKQRQQAIQEGLKKAVQVPLQTARLSLEALQLCRQAAEKGNVNSMTDAGVGAQMAYAGVVGGVFNVLTNLGDIADIRYVEEMKATCQKLRQEAEEILQHTLDRVENYLADKT